MQPSEEAIREQQQAVWNQFSPGWKKWDDFMMQFLRPMGAAIVNALELQPTDAVLDIATGTGEPGLTIASLVPDGTVIGTDLSEGMLATAGKKRNAWACIISGPNRRMSMRCRLRPTSSMP